MKILIIGYGKMGKLIEQLALKHGHEIFGIIDMNDQFPKFYNNKPDVAIEFTNPSSVLQNIKKCLDVKIPIVVGTTGWLNNLSEIQAECQSQNGNMIYASNFSVGINLWFDIIDFASKKFSKISEYIPEITEKHHIHKLDAPSGTAISAAEIVLSSYTDLNTWSKEKENNNLHIESIREGEINGFHELTFSSISDNIKISHEAFSREGFALGAVKAAEWIINKKGLYNFHEVYKEIFDIEQ